MSYTKLFLIPKKGQIESIGEFKNAWLGAIKIWNDLWDEHLREFGEFSMFNRGSIVKLWNLWTIEMYPDCERIVLLSTLDKCICKIENFQKLISAFNDYDKKFPGSHVNAQAQALNKYKSEKGYVGCCWTQTSVNGDSWNIEDEKEDDEWRMFDHSKDKGYGHWYLFQELQENDKG